MKNITNEYIESLNPCEYGIINFNKHYPNYNDTIVNLLQLENIPYNDKIWLACEVLDTMTLVKWAYLCARSVEHNTDDIRVTDCLDVVERYFNGERVSVIELESAADSAWSAWSAAVESAARSAARSAVYSAYSAASAWPAAAAAAADSAAYSAADSAAYSAAARSERENKNIELLIGEINGI